MHGRRRLPVGAEPLMDEENKKAAKAHALVQAALQSRRQGQTPPPIIAAADAVLARNPEVYSLWNLKREVLQPIMASPQGPAETAKQMQLVEQCLQKNHKSYSAWHQRQWLVEQGHVDKAQDLKAVERHLDQVNGDPKNFHAWKYRSWLTRQMQLAPSVDLDFTERLLKTDPSNFSAWHIRMRALAAQHASDTQAAQHASDTQAASATTDAACQPDSSAGPAAEDDSEAAAAAAGAAGAAVGDSESRGTEAQTAAEQGQSDAQPAVPQRAGTVALPLAFSIIEEELRLLHELLAADPANSSSWSFHRWLLECACCDAAGSGERRERAQALLRDERTICEGIAAAEAQRVAALTAGDKGAGGDSLTASLARMAHMRALQAVADMLSLERRMADTEEQAASAREGSLAVLQQLKRVDPGRCGFYDDLLAACASEA
eukprot:jgi/Ulvmu1/12785/UM097_0012.1